LTIPIYPFRISKELNAIGSKEEEQEKLKKQV
jgi:hypothetical protein